jgi:hypothetical protein
MRFKLPKKDGGLQHVDLHFARAEIKYLRALLCSSSSSLRSHSDTEATAVYANEISMDDKAIIHTGSAAVLRQRAVWQLEDARIQLDTHDFAAQRASALQATAFVNVRRNTPRADALTQALREPSANGGQGFYTVRIFNELRSNAAQHLHDLLCIFERAPSEFADEVSGKIRPRLLLRTDGGADVNPRFDGAHMMQAILLWCVDLDCVVACSTAPKDSKTNSAERLNAQATLELSGHQFTADNLPLALEQAHDALANGTFSGLPIQVCCVRKEDEPFFTCMDALYTFCIVTQAQRKSMLEREVIIVQPSDRLMRLRTALGLPKKPPRWNRRTHASRSPPLRELMALHSTHGTTSRYRSCLFRCESAACDANCVELRGPALPLVVVGDTPTLPQPLRDQSQPLHYSTVGVRLAMLVPSHEGGTYVAQPRDALDCHRPGSIIQTFVAALHTDELPTSARNEWLRFANGVPVSPKWETEMRTLAAECCYDLRSRDANIFIDYLQKQIDKRRRRLERRASRMGE